ncbi:hypothetical protein KDAU_43200 [Dictyobacter aurantiacus]|uniref:Uncharacterized protein n=1 Tax=Dictyobacter aurantiacus TaxID=1936993 RepID=A0A401ZJF9_9CHLR|nr:hypothetical protein KDAU_43200 [Dictyobacter aurantiacus]
MNQGLRPEHTVLEALVINEQAHGGVVYLDEALNVGRGVTNESVAEIKNSHQPILASLFTHEEIVTSVESEVNTEEKKTGLFKSSNQRGQGAASPLRGVGCPHSPSSPLAAAEGGKKDF